MPNDPQAGGLQSARVPVSQRCSVILRIQVDGQWWRWNDVANEWKVITRLMGVGAAGYGFLMEDLPVPTITNRRVRFYFTLKGWHTFGRHIYWAVRARGHTVQVRRRARPPASRIVYEDEYQLAVLPPKRRGNRGRESEHDPSPPAS